MRQITIQENNYSLVSTWSEVDAELLLRILPHIYTSDRIAAQNALLPILSDIPNITLLQLTPAQYAQLSDLTGWVWTEPLTMPIIPQIEHGGKVWKLPTACLYDSPFIEYDHLDNFMNADEFDIDRIVAASLRPVGEDGQRIRFDGMQLGQLTAQLADLEDFQKAYVLFFLSGCMRHIQEQYAILWEADDELKPAKDSRYDLHPDDDVDFSWTGAAFSIAEEGAFGDYQKVIFTDCHTILYYLAWKKQNARQMRRALKSQT